MLALKLLESLNIHLIQLYNIKVLKTLEYSMCSTGFQTFLHKICQVMFIFSISSTSVHVHHVYILISGFVLYLYNTTYICRADVIEEETSNEDGLLMRMESSSSSPCEVTVACQENANAKLSDMVVICDARHIEVYNGILVRD